MQFAKWEFGEHNKMAVHKIVHFLVNKEWNRHSTGFNLICGVAAQAMTNKLVHLTDVEGTCAVQL